MSLFTFSIAVLDIPILDFVLRRLPSSEALDTSVLSAPQQTPASAKEESGVLQETPTGTGGHSASSPPFSSAPSLPRRSPPPPPSLPCCSPLPPPSPPAPPSLVAPGEGGADPLSPIHVSDSSPRGDYPEADRPDGSP